MCFMGLFKGSETQSYTTYIYIGQHVEKSYQNKDLYIHIQFVPYIGQFLKKQGIISESD